VNDKVQNDGKQDANYEAGHYRKEKLKVSFLHQYVTGELSQEGDLLPEDQKQAKEGEKSPN
jgi:hypothetical protein